MLNELYNLRGQQGGKIPLAGTVQAEVQCLSRRCLSRQLISHSKDSPHNSPSKEEFHAPLHRRLVHADTGYEIQVRIIGIAEEVDLAPLKKPV